MTHTVEHGDDGRTWTHRRSKLGNHRIQGVGFDGDENDIEWFANILSDDGTRGHTECAICTTDVEVASSQLRSAGGAHQIGYVASSARQAGAKIPAYCAGANDQNAHALFPLECRSDALDGRVDGHQIPPLLLACKSFLFCLMRKRRRCQRRLEHVSIGRLVGIGACASFPQL